MVERPKTDDLYLTAMKGVFWVLCIGVFAFALVQAWPIIDRVLVVLTPFILGLVVAYIFHPIVSFVQFKLRLGRLTGILVVAVGVVTIIGTFFAILIPILYQQTRAVLDAVVQNVSKDGTFDNLLTRFVPDDEARDNFTNLMTDWIQSLGANVKTMVNPEMLGPVAEGSVGVVRGALEALGSIFGWIGGTVATLTLAMIVAFYMLLEMHKIPTIIRRIIPGDQRERVWGVMVRSNRNVGGFLRGQLIACIGVGLIASSVLFLIGLKKYAILIGFTAGAVNFIPYLGPTVGALPAVLWAMFASDLPGWTEGVEMPTWGVRLILLGMVIGGFGFVQAIDGFIFQPFIVGKSAALHPLAVMLALVVGAQFGVGGMIVAVPVACVVKVVFVEFYWRKTSDFIDESPMGDPPAEPSEPGPSGQDNDS